ncbi:MAG: hypothetical protein NTU58_04045 [Candidatus Nealsonbacteria bacterium]|nr:hypothetical protein [Candidatus Nealsonbacteria bacterium]
MEKDMISFDVEKIIEAWKEMEDERKGTDFLEFQKILSSSSIGRIFELRGIDLRELFENLHSKEIKKIEEEIRKEFSNITKAEPGLTEEPPPELKKDPLAVMPETETIIKENNIPEKTNEQREREEKKRIVLAKASTELVISKINEHQDQFKQLEKKILEKMGRYRNVHEKKKKYTLISKIKIFTIMEICDFRSFTVLADWIIGNEKLVIKSLEIDNLPKTREGISSAFYGSRGTIEKHLAEGEIKKIADEIIDEIKKSVENKENNQKLPEKKKEQKFNIAEESLPTEKKELEEKKSEEKKSIIAPTSRAELIISMINKRQNSFELMVKKMFEKMGTFNARQNEKYPLILIFKLFTIKHFYGFVSYARLAIWIEENKELVIKDLGFEDLPKTKTEISNLLNKSEHAFKEYLPEAGIKKIADEIIDEIKKSVENKENNQKLPEKTKTIFQGKKEKPLSPSLKRSSEKPEEETTAMRNYIWGLFNLNGQKDYNELLRLVREKFKGHVITKEIIPQWIQEERSRRNNLTCGGMDCFKEEAGKDKGLTTVYCRTVQRMRGKDENICNTELEELIKKADNRLSAQFLNQPQPLPSRSI